MRKLKLNKKGVFGLNAVQTFFAAILGIGLLAYVIVIIMGTLGTSNIIPQTTLSGSVANETGGYINETGYTLAEYLPSRTITSIVILDSDDNSTIAGSEYTLTNGVLTNATAQDYTQTLISYTYTYIGDSNYQNNLNAILTNTSTGITGFFSSVSPIYAILAILVIILVLTVLVRIVSSPEGNNRSPQL